MYSMHLLKDVNKNSLQHFNIHFLYSYTPFKYNMVNVQKIFQRAIDLERLHQSSLSGSYFKLN